jgi:hypothetical protein
MITVKEEAMATYAAGAHIPIAFSVESVFRIDPLVGRQLLLHAVQWARQRSCKRLKIETQNINVVSWGS